MMSEDALRPTCFWRGLYRAWGQGLGSGSAPSPGGQWGTRLLLAEVAVVRNCPAGQKPKYALGTLPMRTACGAATPAGLG